MPSVTVFYTGDICAHKNKVDTSGFIDRTHSDVSTHDPFPGKDLEGGKIIRHHRIPKDAFRKFMQTGVPPIGTVLIQWAHNATTELIPESALILKDRPVVVGEIVKRNPGDVISGTVIRTIKTCSVLPVGEIRERRSGKTLRATWDGLILDNDAVTSLKDPTAISSVPADELKLTHTYKEGDLLLYKSWIGRITEVVDEVTLRLFDDSVVVVNSEEDLEPLNLCIDRFDAGDLVKTKKGVLRTGRWIFGSYNPNITPIGVVVDVREIEIEMEWLTSSITGKGDGFSHPQPDDILGLDAIQSGELIAYDRTQRPRRSSSASLQTASVAEPDLVPGSRVRFQDFAGACVKYDGSNGHTKIEKIERTDSLGYDMNTFVVSGLDYSSLVPHEVDDEDALYPGEIVCTRQVMDHGDKEWALKPARVGIAQSINAQDRTAMIRWCSDARVLLMKDDQNTKLPESQIGEARGSVEEVSLYDVYAPPTLNFRRGDFVHIRHDDLMKNATESNTDNPVDRDWIGEVVEVHLDGNVTIRLGVSTEVRDIKVSIDRILILLRAEDLHDGGESDGSSMSYMYNSDGSEEEGMDESEAGDIEYIMDDAPYDLEAASDQDVDENAWTTESEADHMSDPEDSDGGPREPLNAIKAPVEPTLNSLPNDSNASVAAPTHTEYLQPVSSSGRPPQFELLEWFPTGSAHHYGSEGGSLSGKQVGAIMKEHKLLSGTSNLPEGVFVRTWESRLDLMRVLIVGPEDTPYAFAPFVFDLRLPSNYPNEPPEVFFHSWGAESSGMQGRVNPNLYENGYVCLSLLGTWNGDSDKGESWTAGKSNILQLLISILGLVLVREPYFNEAGYETLQGLQSSRNASNLYNERTYLRSKDFLIYAIQAISEPSAQAFPGTQGLEDIFTWLYVSSQGPQLLSRTVQAANQVLASSEASNDAIRSPEGTKHRLSKGACLPLKRTLAKLMEIGATYSTPSTTSVEQ